MPAARLEHRRVRQALNESEFAGASPFALFKGWGFKSSDGNKQSCDSELEAKIRTLAQTARMRHPKTKEPTALRFEAGER